MIKNGQIVLRTLAMTEIQQQQTGDYLKHLILDVVKGYNLTPEQIYSITTDNGANMPKCVRLLVAEQENQSEDPFGMDETIDNVVAGVEYEQMLLNSLEHFDVESIGKNPVIIRGLRCAAHTMQLAVEDALAKPLNESESANDIIGRAREIVKHLRTPNIVFLLTAQKLKRPIIDTETMYNLMVFN